MPVRGYAGRFRIFCKLDGRHGQIFIVVSGILIGLLSFFAIYGITPLYVTNDAWIMQGYDDSDILSHYAGWLAFRTSAWHFPLGLADTMAGGTFITYTDSIPIMAFICKCLLSVLHYSGTFQYFGIWTLF